MDFKDYTPDAICQAMNLGSFIEPAWSSAPGPILRMILKPSFHPELAITMTPNHPSALLSVVALREQFWLTGAKWPPKIDHEQTPLSAEAQTLLVEMFRSANASDSPDRRYICLDGMGSDSCLVLRNECQRLSAHVSLIPELDVFVRRVVEIAWSNCRNPRVRNALAHSAYYLGVKYPLDDVLPEPAGARIAVLGSSEERVDYLEMIRRKKAAKPSASQPG